MEGGGGLARGVTTGGITRGNALDSPFQRPLTCDEKLYPLLSNTFYPDQLRTPPLFRNQDSTPSGVFNPTISPPLPPR